MRVAGWWRNHVNPSTVSVDSVVWSVWEIGTISVSCIIHHTVVRTVVLRSA